MIIYPAIDLKEGQCVRLVQGKAEKKTVYSSDPAAMAASFQEQGAQWLHVVDLDGAFQGRCGNHDVIQKIAAQITIPFQVGGGLRQLEDVENVLAMGARRGDIGTRAVTSPAFVEDLLYRFGAEKFILGLDARARDGSHRRLGGEIKFAGPRFCPANGQSGRENGNLYGCFPGWFAARSEPRCHSANG